MTHNGRVKCGTRNASVQGGGITELQDQVRGERDRQTYREAFRQTGGRERQAGRQTGREGRRQAGRQANR